VVPPGDATPRRWPRFTADGHALAVDLWDRLDPKPIAGFNSFRERLSQALAAGYSPEALRRVVAHVEVWSRAGIEMAFAKSGVNPKASPTMRPPCPAAVDAPSAPPPVSELLEAWETLSLEARESASEEVRRRHPTATRWGDGILWRALVVAAARSE